MNKQGYRHLFALMVVALLSIGSTIAKDFTYKGCKFSTYSSKYTISGKSCTKVNLKGYSGTGSANTSLDFSSYFTYDGTNYVISHIEDAAFQNNKYIKSIKLPEALDYIGWRAFEYCTSLVTFSVNNSSSTTLKIRDHVFNGCTSLKNVSLPSHLKEIEEAAFFNCGNASFSITYRTKLEKIGEDCFANCTNMYGSIPASVTSIGKRAFYNSGITGIVIPQKCEVNQASFAFCKNATYVSWSSSWEKHSELPDSLFYYCSKLCDCNFDGTENKSKIVVPTKIKKVGKYCFMHCSSMEDLVFKNSDITEFKDYAFYGCKELKYSQNLKKLEVVGKYAFYGCSKLPKFYFSEKLKSLGSCAFVNCTSLTKIYFCKSSGGISSFSESCFEGCTSLCEFYELDGTYKSVTHFPQYLSSTGKYAFKGCTSLKKISLDYEKLKTISPYTFQDCTGLETLTCSDNCKLETIDDYAFYNCTKLNFNENFGTLKKIGAYAFYNCSSLRKMYLSSSLNSLGEYAFANSGLYCINTVEGCPLKSLSDYCFYKCTELYKFRELPKGGSWGDVKHLPCCLESTGYAAFKGCTGLRTFELNTKLKTISPYSFRDCTSLTFFTNGKNTSLKTIDQGAFYGCTAFTSLNSHSTLERINDYAFSGCTSLTFVYVSSNVKSIGAQAFYNCNMLNEVDFGSTNKLETIGDYAFQGCSSLKEIYTYDGGWQTYQLPKKIKTLGKSAFYGCSALYKIDFHKDSNLETIGDFAFYNCSGLKYYTFVSATKTIGREAFRGTKVDIVISKATNLQTIGPKAFYSVTAITYITLPNSLKVIGDSAFMNCSNITDCSLISDNLTTIGRSAFEHCTKLRGFRIPKNVTSIGDYAFYNTPAMTVVVVCRSGDPLPITQNTFRGGNSSSTKPNAQLQVMTSDSKKQNAYRTSVGWKDFQSLKFNQTSVETESGMIFNTSKVN